MNVTVFSSSNCGVCHSEMKWLDQNNVTYKNVVIDEDENGIAKMMEATGGAMQGTPFTTVEDGGETKTFAGFDRAKLGAALGIS